MTTGSQYLWFLSRGSGLVLLVLFSAVIVLGVATRTGSAPPRWPRFAVAELHRTLSLFAVALLVLHVVTAILDPFVTIGWAATLLPFASPYRTLATGLGTLAVDLGGAVLLTSLVRQRLGQRAWRAVHWFAYLAWPAAFVHSLTAGNDLGIWWVALIEVGSAAAVATAVLARCFSPGEHSTFPGASPRTPGPGTPRWPQGPRDCVTGASAGSPGEGPARSVAGS
jgi:sulfoxide reductase heme-binding subunit YedZ